MDCDANIRKYWQSKYKEYCAKNVIAQVNKPDTKCIKKDLVFKENLRMGMKKTENSDLSCFELDAGGVGQNFVK